MKSILRSIFHMPGVISHEFSHHIFCIIFNAKVLEVCYYNFKNSSGYVLHERPKHLYQTILISTSPFFFNSILGALISYSPINRLSLSGLGSLNWQDLLMLIISISIGMNAIPSKSDGLSIWNSLDKSDMNLLLKITTRIILSPLILVLLIINMGSSYLKIDLFYGICVCFLGPKFIDHTINLDIIREFIYRIQNL